jgi:hypothetical protein
MTGSILIALAASVLAAGCSATGSANNSPCPGQSSDFSIRVDVSAVKPGTELRLCANESNCVVKDVGESDHPHYIFVGYTFIGASATARARLSLRAARDGHVRQAAVVLPIKQTQFGRCGDYGGPGYAIVNSHVKLSASRFIRQHRI